MTRKRGGTDVLPMLVRRIHDRVGRGSATLVIDPAHHKAAEIEARQ
jgi:hypothetical protein